MNKNFILFITIFFKLLLFSDLIYSKSENMNISLENSLGNFLKIENIKGYFLANEIQYPPDQRVYQANKGYLFYFLVLKNIKVPLIIEYDDLNNIKLVDSKNREIACSMFTVTPPDSNGKILLNGMRSGQTTISCKNSTALLDISLFFGLYNDYKELTLKYNGNRISLKNIELSQPENLFESYDCRGELTKGSIIGGRLQNTHVIGTTVLDLKDLNPNEYILKIDEIDTSSSEKYLGVKVTIQNRNNTPIDQVEIDKSALIEIQYENSSKKYSCIGFLKSLRKNIGPPGTSMMMNFKVVTSYEDGINITPEGILGGEKYQWWVEKGVEHPFTGKGMLPDLTKNTVKIEFIFERENAKVAKLILGKYSLYLN
jgi:hypothetical protein